MEILVFKAAKAPDELKTRLVRQWLNSDKPLADFAQEKRVSPEAFSGWVAKYRKQASIRCRAHGSARSRSITLVKLDLNSILNSDVNCREVVK